MYICANFFIFSECRLIEVSDNPYALELENNSIMSLINKSGMHVLNAINNVIYKYTIALKLFFNTIKHLV